ncbi:MAG: hypothetical protein JWO30_4139 [Fibrobacteres bacterium]|nr:hypothetical protein [Fibrobacterota bacterium]
MDMQRLVYKTVWLGMAMSVCLAAPRAEVKVVRSPLEIGTALDLGQVVKGVNMIDSSVAIHGLMIQRTGVSLNQTTTVNDRLVIKVGVGGLFFYGFPEVKSNAQSRSIRFGPGVGQAQGVYNFGDIDHPKALLQFGYFPYKYNPDAKNLGEFLFRSGTYPGYEVTGGWSIMNSALYMASGLRMNANFFDGKLITDVNMFLEKDLEPIYDLSPGLVVTYKPADAFEVGVGAAFAHLIPVNPSKLNSKSYKYQGDSLYRYIGDTLHSDAASMPYTFKGTKLMARASMNFGALMDNPYIGKEGLKFYFEAALLGVKNYPYFFEDRMARVPLVFGVNLPTLNFFDVLSVEMEYRKWDFRNSTKRVGEDNQSVWRVPEVQILDTTYRSIGGKEEIKRSDNPNLYHPSMSKDESARAAQAFIDSYDPNTNPSGGLGYNGILVDPGQTVANTQGNLKWTVYVKKQLITGVNAYLQVASDHMRGIRYESNTLDFETLTQKPSDWYYLFRLEFGI